LITAAAVLSLIAIAVAISPVDEASARECNSDNKNDNNDQNNNSNDDSVCTNQPNSNYNHKSIAKDTTPFVLPMPFP
jgi:hypothetical protein